MNEPQAPDLARLLGQRRAFAAVAGRCSAAHAQLLRRIHDEKLYLPYAPTWEAFCGPNLAISRRHADKLIALLNRFGPIYFELSQLIGLSPQQYLAIEPASAKTASSSMAKPSASSPKTPPNSSKPSASSSPIPPRQAPLPPSRDPARPRRRSHRARPQHREPARRPLQFLPRRARPRTHPRSRHRTAHDPHATRN